MRRFLGLLLAAWLSFGCSEVSRRATASVSDYAAYRRYRVATNVDARLSAGYDYLVQHPRGRWRRDVHSWLDGAQRAYVDAAWDRLSALRHFIEIVPDGEEARRAARRIVELELTSRWYAAKDAEFERWVRALDARLELARVGRKHLVEAMIDWSKLLSGLRGWGRRTHEQDHELIYAFRLTEPEGHCTGRRCVKALSLSYAIPEDKTQSQRVALLDVVMQLDDHGGVESITLTGPELFTRLGEALFLHPILPTDLRARVDALARVRQLVRVAVEPALPAARCDVAPVSPALLHRRCDGTDLELIAAADAGEEDRLVVRAAPTLTLVGESPREAPEP